MHQGGKSGTGHDCDAEQLVKTCGNGATPALDNKREGIAHSENESARKVDPNRKDIEKRFCERVVVH